MKYIFSLLLTFCLASGASAQDETHPFKRGTKLVGFSLNSIAQRSESDGSSFENTIATLNGQFGMFVLNGLALGIDLKSSISNSSESNGDTGNFSQETVQNTVGVFAAYYIKLSTNFAIYPEIQAFTGRRKTDDNSEVTLTGSTVGLGLAYRINPTIGMHVKLSSVRDSTTSGSLKSTGKGSQFLGGFQIFF